MIKRTTWIAILMAFGVASSGLFAQEEESDSVLLTIGSEAPSLDIEYWVQNGDGKFQPVTKFEDGKVYMVEFWATWCGPCISSMPHIVELQAEYADRGFQVVSISDEDLETVEEFLGKKVRSEGEDEDEQTYKDLTSSYCLTTDPDGSVQNDYMRAAKQNGIPTAFIVGKSGVVEWIGHPMEIDEPLAQIMDDGWDRDAFAVSFKADQKVDEILGSLGQLMRQGKADEVIKKISEAIESSDDEAVNKRLVAVRTRVMVSSGAEGAVEAMNHLVKSLEDVQALGSISWAVVQLSEQQEVSNDLIQAATVAINKAMALEPRNGDIIDTFAHLQYLQGNLDEAIKLSEQAVELSGDDLPHIAEFLEKLKEEKAGGEKKDD